MYLLNPISYFLSSYYSLSTDAISIFLLNKNKNNILSAFLSSKLAASFLRKNLGYSNVSIFHVFLLNLLEKSPSKVRIKRKIHPATPNTLVLSTPKKLKDHTHKVSIFRRF